MSGGLTDWYTRFSARQERKELRKKRRGPRRQAPVVTATVLPDMKRNVRMAERSFDEHEQRIAKLQHYRTTGPRCTACLTGVVSRGKSRPGRRARVLRLCMKCYQCRGAAGVLAVRRCAKAVQKHGVCLSCMEKPVTAAKSYVARFARAAQMCLNCYGSLNRTD